jgi:PAS domain S-box-containing protein
LIVVPLISKDRVIGAIHFRSARPDAYSDQDLKLAETIGSQIAGAVANAQLFADRKQAEKALRESEIKYREIFESLEDLYYQTDSQGIIRVLSPSLYRFTGWRVEDLIGKPVTDVYVDPGSREKLLSILAQKGFVRDYGALLKQKDGTPIPVSVSAHLLLDEQGRPAGVSGIVRDISERKRAEEEIKHTLSLLDATLESTADGLLVVDRDGQIEKFNRKFIQMWRIPESMIASGDDNRVLAFVLDQLTDPNGFLVKVRELYGQPAAESYDFVEFKDGRIFERYSQPQTIGDAMVGRVWSFRDITERKRVETALRSSEAQLANACKMVHLGPWEYDVENDLFTFTDSFYAIFRTTAEQSGGYTMSSADYTKRFVHPEDASLVGLEIQKAIETDDPKFSRRLEHRILYVDGEIGYITVQFFVVKDSQGRTVRTYGVNQDITDRKRAEEERQRLEERLSRAEKMEALGTLAGGVAHDLNNVLGVLVGYSELLLMEILEGDPLRRHVSNILQSSQRAAAIIQDLLTLARRGVAVSEVVNLNDLISDHLKTPEFEKLKAYHPQVAFRTDLDKDLMNIKGSPVHLSKTIMNLLSNAAEAISDRGEVTILTENRYLDQPITGYEDIREGEYVVLGVSDNGKGISVGDIGKIFEPFYTKKVMGRSGTGLGLAVVWGTVKDHHGYIDVRSEEGKGSTFTLYFPVTREEMLRDQKVVSAEAYMGRGESILVVDDVKEQRELATAMLSRLGYQVHSVSSGNEAVIYFKTNRVDLLVLDMIMDPGIDGLETYQRIVEINPNQKAIIVSGFSETDRVKKAQELGAGAYVRKPYILEKIGLAIRRELDK